MISYFILSIKYRMNTNLQNIVEEGDIIIANPESTSETVLFTSTQFKANGNASLNEINNGIDGVISHKHTKKNRHQISVYIPELNEEDTMIEIEPETQITSQETDLINELQECNITVDLAQLSQDMQYILEEVKKINEKYGGNDIEVTAQVVKYLIKPETQDVVNRYTQVITSLTTNNIKCLAGMSDEKMCYIAKHTSSSLDQIPNLTDLNRIIKLYSGPMKKLILWSLDQIRNMMEECNATLDADKLKQLEELYINVVDLLNIKPRTCPPCPPCSKEEDSEEEELLLVDIKSKKEKKKHILNRTLVDINQPISKVSEWIKKNQTLVIILVVVFLVVFFHNRSK